MVGLFGKGPKKYPVSSATLEYFPAIIWSRIAGNNSLTNDSGQ